MIVLVGAALTILSLATFALWPRARGAGFEPAPTVEVHVAPFQMEAGYRLSRSHVGQAEPPRISRVGGELGGAVVEMHADEGDRITRGQPLARFDAARLQARRAEVAAELARQQATLSELRAGPREQEVRAQEAQWRALSTDAALARAKAERVARVHAEGAVSAQEFDEARLDAERADAAADAARARLDELEAGTRAERIDAQAAAVDALRASLAAIDVDIAKATVRAPFDGIVGRRLADEGDVLAPGTPLLELREAFARGPELRIGVTAAIAAALRPGAALAVRVRGEEAAAEVLAVRPDRTASTRTVPVLARLTDDDPPPLADGELVEVDFPVHVQDPGGWVPLAGLSEGPRGLWRCFALAAAEDLPADATHLVEPRMVEVLHVEADRAFVRGAITDGDLVVQTGTHRVLPGTAVRIARSNRP